MVPSSNSRFPEPTKTGKTHKRNSSIRSCFNNVWIRLELPWTRISPPACSLSRATAVAASPRKQGGVVPFHFLKRSRGDVFSHAVELGCHGIVRIRDAWPVRGEDFVRLATEQQRVRFRHLLEDDLAHHVVPILHRPTAMREAALAVFIRAAWPLHHSVEGQKGADN